MARLYLKLGDWKAVVEEVINKNVLQARTIASLQRACREVIARLKTLSQEEVSFLVETSPQDQGYLLWIAVCRQYKFIAEFAVEVLRERYITLKEGLSYEDFDSFFNQKAEWHPELDQIQPATRKKLRQVLFRMLREADLLTADNAIKAAMLSPQLISLISRRNRQEIFYFPAFDSDMKGVPSDE